MEGNPTDCSVIQSCPAWAVNCRRWRRPSPWRPSRVRGALCGATTPSCWEATSLIAEATQPALRPRQSGDRDGGASPRHSAVNELTACGSPHPAHNALRAATTSFGFEVSIQLISLGISSSSACSRSQFTYSSLASSTSLFASAASSLRWRDTFIK